MITSELITAHHLTRTAVVYIRQSSPHQVVTNQESLTLQYALQQRAIQFGWRAEDIEVIDADLGLSGSAAEHRAGFKDLAARVTLGKIGIIFSTEVNRLSRNCSDWYPLLDVCGYKGCLIADRDGVYDPATANGRLLLGLKGTISEAELFTIRSRMTAGLLNKAARGDLALQLPTGFPNNVLGNTKWLCFIQRLLPLLVDHQIKLSNPHPFAPSAGAGLHRYYGPVRPSGSASVLSLSRDFRFGFLPSHRNDRFPSSTREPGSDSRHLYAGHHLGGKQVAPRFIPR